MIGPGVSPGTSPPSSSSGGGAIIAMRKNYLGFGGVPSSYSIVAPSGSLGDVDGTNQLVTFTVPANGAVVIDVTLPISISGSASLQFAMSGLPFPDNLSMAIDAQAAAADGARHTILQRFMTTGLSPGPMTSSLQWALSGSGSALIAGDGQTPITYVVYAGSLVT